MGRSFPLACDSGRRLRPELLSLHRTNSSAYKHGGTSGRVSLVELSWKCAGWNVFTSGAARTIQSIRARRSYSTAYPPLIIPLSFRALGWLWYSSSHEWQLCPGELHSVACYSFLLFRFAYDILKVWVSDSHTTRGGFTRSYWWSGWCCLWLCYCR